MAKQCRPRVQIFFDKDDGMTEQCHVNECDIEYLLRKHGVGRDIKMPDMPFTDLTQIPSFQECMNVVTSMGNYFTQLPLKVRQAYDHDVSKFMEAVEDPSRVDELRELGLYGAKEGAKTGQDAQNNPKPQEGASTNEKPEGGTPEGVKGA